MGLRLFTSIEIIHGSVGAQTQGPLTNESNVCPYFRLTPFPEEIPRSLFWTHGFGPLLRDKILRDRQRVVAVIRTIWDWEIVSGDGRSRTPS